MVPSSLSSHPKLQLPLQKPLAVNGGQGAASARVREQVEQLTQSVVRALLRSRPSGGTFHIEDIQDQVELTLMRSGEHNVARAYVLYREKRNQERVAQQSASQDQLADAALPVVQVSDNGVNKPSMLLVSEQCLRLPVKAWEITLMLVRLWARPLRTYTMVYLWHRCMTRRFWPHAP